jgi:hypothetical protein
MNAIVNQLSHCTVTSGKDPLRFRGLGVEKEQSGAYWNKCRKTVIEHELSCLISTCKTSNKFIQNNWKGTKFENLVGFTSLTSISDERASFKIIRED